MFRVTQSPLFWSTVEVEIIPEEGGKPKKFNFDQQFPRLTSAEFKAFADWINRDKVEDPVAVRSLLTGEWKRVVYPHAEPDSDQAKLQRMKWRGVVDEKDQPLEASDGNIDALLTNTV